MVITCPNYDAKYSIDRASVKGKGARATCKSCKTVFPIYLEQPEVNEEEVQEESALPSIEDLDVYALNFKEVGLKSWKVKIKMGLVYDFSDYKTLSKYIREGKVATTDNLSSDEGKTWTPLNDIEDLEKHFCEVYLRKKQEFLEGGAKEIETPKATPKKPAPEPALGSGLSDLASVLAEAEAEVDGRPSPRSHPQKRNKNSRKNPNRSPKKPTIKDDPAPKKGNNVFVLLLILLGVSGGVFFYVQQQQKNEKLAKEASEEQQKNIPTEVDKKASEAQNKAIEEKMKRIARERASKKEKEEAEKEKKKEPEVVQTKEELEILARLEAKEKNGNKTAGELLKEGQNAIRGKQWKKAETIFQQVVSKNPTAKNKVLLGRVLYEQKKFGKARELLKQAAAVPESHKWLGMIAKEEGDDAGANQHFSIYLKSNPQDANTIRGVMNGN